MKASILETKVFVQLSLFHHAASHYFPFSAYLDGSEISRNLLFGIGLYISDSLHVNSGLKHIICVSFLHHALVFCDEAKKLLIKGSP
jgi:hypothetical protein